MGDAAERRSVAILLFEDVEVLDFAGPYEVFSRTRLEPGVASRRTRDSAPFDVLTVAREPGPIAATGGLRVIPDYSFGDVPEIDILVVPGGFGTRPLLADDQMIEWIRDRSGRARRVTSVCTGALLLAAAGVLQGRRATTHWSALDALGEIDPTIEVARGARVVEDGVVTSAGVSAGIDMALTIVARLHGQDVAEETARYMEYRWTSEGANGD